MAQRSGMPGALLDLLREDYRHHGSTLASPGFRGLAVHRLNAWRAGLASRTARALLGPPLVLAERRVRNRHGIELPSAWVLGRRVRISDLGDIVIAGKVRLGDDCDIGPGVTLGRASLAVNEAPTLGNRVCLGPGSVVVGGVHVGDDALLGPNSVVITDVPAAATVSASPAVLTEEPVPPAAPARDARDGAAGVWRTILEDRAAHGGSWLAPGVQALAVHRVRRCTRGAASVGGRLADAVARTLATMIRSRHRIDIAPSATVGRRVRLAARGRIVVAPDAEVGDDCVLDERVIVGWQATGAPPAGGTRLGRRVVVAEGSTVAAGVSVGDDARIGFNTHVAASVPARAVATAPTARVLRPTKLRVPS